MTEKQKTNSSSEKDKEVIIEFAKQMVSDFIDAIALLSPEDAERRCRQIKTLCEVDKVLPDDFKRKAFEQAREMECIANMRHCDRLLREANILSVQGKMTERSVPLMEARRYFGRACQLGANNDWRKAFERATETIQLTGHRLAEYSTAKPPDIAPRAPNRAKC
jgi:hypothetical protein